MYASYSNPKTPLQPRSMQRISLSLPHPHTLTYSLKHLTLLSSKIRAGKVTGKAKTDRKVLCGVLLPTNPPSSGILSLPSAGFFQHSSFHLSNKAIRRKTANDFKQLAFLLLLCFLSVSPLSPISPQSPGGSRSISDTLPRTPLQEAGRQSHR